VHRTPPDVQDAMFAGIYLKVHNAPKLKAIMASIKAWKAVELEKVTVKSLFLENRIDIATHRYL
jgi:hypothetical protein